MSKASHSHASDISAPRSSDASAHAGEVARNEAALLDMGDALVRLAREKGADVAEAVLRSGSELSCRFRDRNAEFLHEASARAAGLRVMKGQRVAVVHGNDLRESGLASLVEDAMELVALTQEDRHAGPPDASRLASLSARPDLSLWDPKAYAFCADQAAAFAREAEAAALDADPRITASEGASCDRMYGSNALVTSGGFRGASSGTYVSVVAKPVADDKDQKKRAGYHWSARRYLSDLDDPAAVGREATAKTLAKLGARKVPTQEVPVVFDPDAARSILGLLAGCIVGGSVWRQSSYLAARLGSQVASKMVTIVDNPLIPRGPGSRAFDGEGLPSRINTVVEQGVLQQFLLDSYSARKLDMESTASAARGGSGGVSASTSNFILMPGDASPEDILRDTPKGLYVTEMMGFGFNAVTGDFSRGASGFWIEGGQKTFPVSEVTISLNLNDLLQRIDAVGNDLDNRSSVVAPTFRVSSMSLAGA